MKRALLVTTSYPERIDGAAAAGVFVRDFATGLSESGVCVDVVAPGAEGGFRQEEGLGVTRFQAPRLPLSLLKPTRIRDWQPIITTLGRGQSAVMEVCASRRPDHILALWTLPCGHWALRSSLRFGIPYSTWALGSDVWSLASLPGFRQYTAHVLRRAAHRFADGYELAAEVDRIGRQPCTFLPSSRFFGPLAGIPPTGTPPYRLAFLGRWHPNKGIDLLLDALGQLDQMDWSRIAAVRIHGGGPMADMIREKVSMLRQAGHPVEMGGYLDLAGAVALFEWADYVLIPSRIESIPVVFSDAMQAGRPVIASPVGDIPRLIKTYQCGVVADRPDAAALAEAIRRAITLSPHEFQAQLPKCAAEFGIPGAVSTFLETIGTP